MEMKDKANQVLAVLTQLLGGMKPMHCAGDGVHAFELDCSGIAHRVGFPEDVFALRNAQDLAIVAAGVLAMLREDLAPARVVVRAGIFETMLAAAAPYPARSPALP